MKKKIIYISTCLLLVILLGLSINRFMKQSNKTLNISPEALQRLNNQVNLEIRIKNYPLVLEALKNGDNKPAKGFLTVQMMSDVIKLTSNPNFKYETFKVYLLRLKPFIEEIKSDDNKFNKWRIKFLKNIKKIENESSSTDG